MRGEGLDGVVVIGGGERAQGHLLAARAAQQPGQAASDGPVPARRCLGPGQLAVDPGQFGVGGLGQAPAGGVDLGHGDPPAGPQHAQRLGEYGLRVGQVLEYIAQQHEAGRVVGERQGRAVGHEEFGSAAGGVGQQVAVDVDGGVGEAGQGGAQPAGDRPGAGADLDERAGVRVQARLAQDAQLGAERQLGLGLQAGQFAGEPAGRGGGGVVRAADRAGAVARPACRICRDRGRLGRRARRG